MELRTQHKDFVHDVSFDYYGKRLATCSSDQKINVCGTFSEGFASHDADLGAGRQNRDLASLCDHNGSIRFYLLYVF